jgi:hypothetical protein
VADFISELASKSGISPDQARKGVGAVLALLKEKLPPGAFSRVEAAVPDADGLVADAQPAEGAPGGLLESVAGAVGKLVGGDGGAAQLTSTLAHLGLSAEQLQKFLPTVVEFLKRRLPEDVVKKLGALLLASEAGS